MEDVFGRVLANRVGQDDTPKLRSDGKIAYRNWWITYDPPPIPDRTCDWQFWHDDYDGAPNYGDEGPADNRCGYAASLEAAKAEIDMREDDV